MSNDNIKIVIETNKEGLTLKDINEIKEHFNDILDDDFIGILEGNPLMIKRDYKSNETILKFERLPIGSKIIDMDDLYIEALSNILEIWCVENKLPLLCADELRSMDCFNLNKDQIEFLDAFILLWMRVAS